MTSGDCPPGSLKAEEGADSVRIMGPEKLLGPGMRQILEAGKGGKMECPLGLSGTQECLRPWGSAAAATGGSHRGVLNLGDPQCCSQGLDAFFPNCPLLRPPRTLSGAPEPTPVVAAAQVPVRLGCEHSL